MAFLWVGNMAATRLKGKLVVSVPKDAIQKKRKKS